MECTRTTDGATYGEYEIQRSADEPCVVQWVVASLFPPLDGGGAVKARGVHPDGTHGQPIQHNADAYFVLSSR
jgi:hypothetical protein